jgi:hypothetical protein
VVQRVIADRDRFQLKPAFQHSWAGKSPSEKHNSGTSDPLMSATPRTRRRSHRSEQPVRAYPGFQKLDAIPQGFLIAVDGSEQRHTQDAATDLKMRKKRNTTSQKTGHPLYRGRRTACQRAKKTSKVLALTRSRSSAASKVASSACGELSGRADEREVRVRHICLITQLKAK